MTGVHRCERGPHCHNTEPVTDPDGTVGKQGAICDRPLCDTCERHIARTLDEVPALYVKARNAILTTGTVAVRTDYVMASKGSPLPLNARPLYLTEQVWWLLVSWEDEIRAIAKLTPRVREGRREGRQVADAAALLAAHLTAWIAAPETEFTINTGRDPSNPHVEAQTGWEAASQLLDWRSSIRNLPGLDKRASKAVRRYEHRCPACGVRAITHQAGDDLMQCQSCGATAPYLPTLPREADYQEQAS